MVDFGGLDAQDRTWFKVLRVVGSNVSIGHLNVIVRRQNSLKCIDRAN